MKYTIEGFSQKNAIAMGLNIEDLIFLRWFIDFKEEGYMKRKYISEKNDMGYWVSYKYVIKELPILFSYPPHISNLKYNDLTYEEKKKANKNWINACKKKIQRMLSGNLSKVLTRDIEKEKDKNNKGQSQINSFVYLCVNKLTFKFLISDSYGLYIENHNIKKNTSGQKCPADTSGQKCPVYPSTNILYSSTTQSKQKSKDFSSSEKHKNIKLIEEKTHLIINSINKENKVINFNYDRLKESIQIFKKESGKHFSLLEKIYNDDKNFIKNINSSNLSTNKNKFDNMDAEYKTFTKYTNDELQSMSDKNKMDKQQESSSNNDFSKIMYERCVNSNWNCVETTKKYAIEYAKSNGLDYPKDI